MISVLQIANKAPYPANDGSSIAIFNMAKGFIENNVDLTLLTINTKKHFKPDENVPEDFRKKSNYASVYKNTNTSSFGAFLNLFSSQSYFVSRFRFKNFEKKLAETLKQKKFDVVQLEGLFMASYIPVIRKHSSALVVLRAHNIEHFIWNRHILREVSPIKKFYLNLQNKRLRKFELDTIAKVDAVLPISTTDALEFKKLGCLKPKLTCITGVDVKEYQTKLMLPVKPKTVFYFGSMDWLPNQEAAKWFLNNCWDTVHQEVPDAKLIIAGRGMPLEFFHITKPKVQIVENVENGKAFFEQHELMIVPLHSGSGLRIKIVEGMSYGKAIVSTSIGAEGINCESGKNIIIADTASDFSNAVIKLLKDKDLRQKIEQGAAEFAGREFDNLTVVARLVQFYKQMLNV